METPHLLALTAAVVLLPLLRCVLGWRRDRQFARAHGCEPAPMDNEIKWLDPCGLGLLRKLEHQLSNHGLLEFMRARFRENGNTFKTRVLLDDFYWTCEPQNVKTMLATQFRDFDVGIDRYHNFKPLVGYGVFTSDGETWERARALIRPNFVRDQIADIAALEVHFQNMLALIPKDGQTPIHLKDLFLRITIDSSSEMLFGESLNALTNTDSHLATAQVATALWKCQAELARRARLGRLADWNVSRDFLDACAVAQRYVDGLIHKTLQGHRKKGSGDDAPAQNPQETAREGRYVFLDELAKAIDDPVAIRDHLLNVLLPARDSTATLLANVFFAITKDQRVLKKLQAEVADLNGQYPEFETLKSMKYLKWVMNETLRLWPNVPLNGRQANRDVTLPVGGGSEGKHPIHIKKGQNVAYSVYVMHRRKDLWGPDADEFVPERWDGLRPGWEYLPFNGGPRICIGQQLALTEAGYVTVRLLQCFRQMESLDTSDWQESLGLTCAPLQTVAVRMIP